MRIAVAGATGNIGARTVSALQRGGHDAVGISRSQGVDLLTGPGVWAQWPILVIAVAFGWQAAPYLQRGPIQSRTIRAAVAIAALCLANLFTWDGYFWAIWPALGIVLLHILRRTRKTES